MFDPVSVILVLGGAAVAADAHGASRRAMAMREVEHQIGISPDRSISIPSLWESYEVLVELDDVLDFPWWGDSSRSWEDTRGYGGEWFGETWRAMRSAYAGHGPPVDVKLQGFSPPVSTYVHVRVVRGQVRLLRADGIIPDVHDEIDTHMDFDAMSRWGRGLLQDLETELGPIERDGSIQLEFTKPKTFTNGFANAMKAVRKTYERPALRATNAWDKIRARWHDRFEENR